MRGFRWREARPCVGSAEERPCVPSRASTDRRAHACARDGGARVSEKRNGGPCEQRRRNDRVGLYRDGQLWKLWRTAQTEVGKLAEGPRRAGRGAAHGETTALARPALGIASWQRGSPATAADEKNGVASWQRGEVQRSQKKNKETVQGVHDMQKAERRASRARCQEGTK